MSRRLGEIVYCVHCKQRHEESDVAVGEVRVETPGWENAPGIKHRHDGTVWAQHFSCEAGHEWTVRWRKRCPHYDCKWPLAPDGPGPVPGSGELE
jgi:hypothetical protein